MRARACSFANIRPSGKAHRIQHLQSNRNANSAANHFSATDFASEFNFIAFRLFSVVLGHCWNSCASKSIRFSADLSHLVAIIRNRVDVSFCRRSGFLLVCNYGPWSRL